MSDEALWTAMNVAMPYAAGFSYGEIAAQLGKSRKWVARRMHELRVEILASFGLHPDDTSP